MNIFVSGSLAYDRIMDFSGRFRDHILPEKIHILNVSFVVDKIKEGFGGTAGNIAYNLALLGEKPKVLGVVGDDFGKYKKWLSEKNVDISKIKIASGSLTAAAHIMTDQDDNQISAFYPGSCDISCCGEVKKILEGYSKEEKKNILAIVSAEYQKRMMSYIAIYKKERIPYIFDPGQQIFALTKEDIIEALNGAKVLIGNDYEIQIILNKIGKNLGRVKGLDLPECGAVPLGDAVSNGSTASLDTADTDFNLEKMLEILVITKGAEGSIIYNNGKKIIIPPARPKNVCDPTGAGDAYRAGFIKGLVESWPLEKTGRLAGLVSVYTVEKYGTQTHTFNWDELAARYRENFGEEL